MTTNESDIKKRIDELEDKALMLQITSVNVQKALLLRKNNDVSLFIKYSDILTKHEENQIVLIDEAYSDCLRIVQHLKKTSKDVQIYAELLEDDEVKLYNQYHKTIGTLKYQLRHIEQENALKKELKKMA